METKTPIIESKVELSYSKGVYAFFCKTTSKLFALVMAFFAGIAGTDPESLRPAKFGKLVSCIWIVNHMANKLEGICSVSSSVHDNWFCQRWRNIAGCICEHCYAHNQQSYQTGLKEHNIINGIILRNILIPVKAFKALNIMFSYLRIESFGDVANVTQARNYIRIIKAFPRKRCAIWTKNVAIWQAAFDAEGKPENTTFVVSSPLINKPIDDPIANACPYIDHIFTVYTKAYAKQNGITINCGGRKCMECIKAKKNCYFRNDTLYINELKK